MEIASSSASIDLHDKFNAYRRNGVQEYLVWQIHEQKLSWFVLDEGRYEPMSADEEGVLRSQVFPGLWLHGPALLAGDLTKVVACLQEGLKSPEYAAFQSRLRERGRPEAASPPKPRG